VGRPDGVLLLGGSESTIYRDESFEPFPPASRRVSRARVKAPLTAVTVHFCSA
jgi:hypothetical protein